MIRKLVITFIFLQISTQIRFADLIPNSNLIKGLKDKVFGEAAPQQPEERPQIKEEKIVEEQKPNQSLLTKFLPTNAMKKLFGGLLHQDHKEEEVHTKMESINEIQE